MKTVTKPDFSRPERASSRCCLTRRSSDEVAVGKGGLYEDFDRLTTSPAPPIRRMATLRPTSVTALPDGRQLIDVGQNINGWAYLSDLGPAGTKLVLTHGEALDPEGAVTTENIRAFDWATRQLLPAG